jgi:hypothetical protein
VAEERPTQRPGGVIDGKQAKGCEQRGNLIVGWKEGLAENGRQTTIDGQVIPFEHAANFVGEGRATGPASVM